MRLRPLAIAALSAFAALGHAWNATGHMVVAAIARDNLTPAARTEADRLLKVDADRPGSDDFVAVGPWADDVRNDRKETGPWHYKDMYFRPDGKPATHTADPVNAVTKIREFTALLHDKSKPDAQRAEALRFLIHLVADVHQPLHASSRESDAHPEGDRGGNDYPIAPPADSGDRGPKNLHSLWDGGVGLLAYAPREQTRSLAISDARLIEALVPRSSLTNVSTTDPDAWVAESFDLTKRVVYGTPEGAVPSAAYMAQARPVVVDRLARAGYRLADLLNGALGN